MEASAHDCRDESRTRRGLAWEHQEPRPTTAGRDFLKGLHQSVRPRSGSSGQFHSNVLSCRAGEEFCAFATGTRTKSPSREEIEFSSNRGQARHVARSHPSPHSILEGYRCYQSARRCRLGATDLPLPESTFSQKFSRWSRAEI